MLEDKDPYFFLCVNVNTLSTTIAPTGISPIISSEYAFAWSFSALHTHPKSLSSVAHQQPLRRHYRRHQLRCWWLPADSLSPSGKHANFAVEQANTWQAAKEDCWGRLDGRTRRGDNDDVNGATKGSLNTKTRQCWTRIKTLLDLLRAGDTMRNMRGICILAETEPLQVVEAFGLVDAAEDGRPYDHAALVRRNFHAEAELSLRQEAGQHLLVHIVVG